MREEGGRVIEVVRKKWMNWWEEKVSGCLKYFTMGGLYINHEWLSE